MIHLSGILNRPIAAFHVAGSSEYSVCWYAIFSWILNRFLLRFDIAGLCGYRPSESGKGSLPLPSPLACVGIDLRGLAPTDPAEKPILRAGPERGVRARGNRLAGAENESDEPILRWKTLRWAAAPCPPSRGRMGPALRRGAMGCSDLPLPPSPSLSLPLSRSLSLAPSLSHSLPLYFFPAQLIY